MAISETQKYGHVTYFFNGNRPGVFDKNLETYVEVPSDVVPFEQRPWMKCAEITDKVIEAIETLTPREQQVLKMRYGLDMDRTYTLEEIGNKFNITREIARQLELRTIRNLRHPKNSKKINEFEVKCQKHQRVLDTYSRTNKKE